MTATKQNETIAPIQSDGLKYPTILGGRAIYICPIRYSDLQLKVDNLDPRCLEMLPCDLSNRSGTMRIEAFQPIIIDLNFFTPALVLSMLQIHPTLHHLTL
jgi:hypothetical protein